MVHAAAEGEVREGRSDSAAVAAVGRARAGMVGGVQGRAGGVVELRVRRAVGGDAHAG